MIGSQRNEKCSVPAPFRVEAFEELELFWFSIRVIPKTLNPSLNTKLEPERHSLTH